MSTKSIPFIGRRDALALLAAASATNVLQVGAANSAAAQSSTPKVRTLAQKAFVYTELQVSVPFDKAPWRERNPVLKTNPGLVNKTWLSGLGNHSLGGLYAFDTIENAQAFVVHFSEGARKQRVAHTSRVFDAEVTAEASRELDSVHYGATLSKPPAAFVYTEVAQLPLVPFAQRPWREVNPVLKQQPGLLAKTWLSGFGTNTTGGLYAFDSIEHAQAFAIDYFPSAAARLKAAFCTRIFDAQIVAEASRDMGSPFFAV